MCFIFNLQKHNKQIQWDVSLVLGYICNELNLSSYDGQPIPGWPNQADPGDVGAGLHSTTTPQCMYM
jgi:hypothetical protein